MRILRDDWGIECRDEIGYLYRSVSRGLENDYIYRVSFLVRFFLLSHCLEKMYFSCEKATYVHMLPLDDYTELLNLRATRLGRPSSDKMWTHGLIFTARQIPVFIMQIFVDQE